MADKHQPWEQRDDEPEEWFGRFRAYCDLGPGRRSVPAIYRIEIGDPGAKRAPGNWERARHKYDWVARARAWDAHKREEREQRREEREQQQLAAEDRFVDDQMERRRQRVANLSSLADRLLVAALGALPVGADGRVAMPDEDTMKVIDRAEKLAKTAQEESRRECQVSDETLARLIELARGAAR